MQHGGHVRPILKFIQEKGLIKDTLGDKFARDESFGDEEKRWVNYSEPME
jgi:hypothetical protein